MIDEKCPYCEGEMMGLASMKTCAKCKIMSNGIDTFTWGAETERLPQLIQKGLLVVKMERVEE